MALGPVHYAMYEKIKLENELIENLEKLAEKKEWNLSKDYAENYQPLDQVIDMDNIHAWIQSHMDDVERRLAACSEELLRDHPERMDAVKHEAYLAGFRYSTEAPDVRSAYEILDTTLLNGMPCDHVNEVTENSDNRICWREKADMHSAYWNNPEIYRMLRDALSEGLLAKTGLHYEHQGNEYTISGTTVSL